MTIVRGDDAPGCAPPDPNPTKPAITLPPLSCDSHFHVFGPRRVFPFAGDRPYTPEDAPKEDLFRLHKFLGFERGVFVESSSHGRDHAVVLDFLATAKGRYRAVGLIDPSTPKAEVMRLHEAGVCGARLPVPARRQSRVQGLPHHHDMANAPSAKQVMNTPANRVAVIQTVFLSSSTGKPQAWRSRYKQAPAGPGSRIPAGADEPLRGRGRWVEGPPGICIHRPRTANRGQP